MTVHNYRSRQVHETLNGINPSSGFRDMRSAKSGPNLWQIWQVFGPWASPYGANGRMSMTVHNYRPRQFHRTSNGENPSSGYRDMGSTSLAAARPTARPPVRPPARLPARTVTTIPLQPGGLRGKKWPSHLRVKPLTSWSCLHYRNEPWTLLDREPDFTALTQPSVIWDQLSKCLLYQGSVQSPWHNLYVLVELLHATPHSRCQGFCPVGQRDLELWADVWHKLGRPCRPSERYEKRKWTALGFKRFP